MPERPPLPSFTKETAIQKSVDDWKYVEAAESRKNFTCICRRSKLPGAYIWSRGGCCLSKA